YASRSRLCSSLLQQLVANLSRDSRSWNFMDRVLAALRANPNPDLNYAVWQRSRPRTSPSRSRFMIDRPTSAARSEAHWTSVVKGQFKLLSSKIAALTQCCGNLFSMSSAIGFNISATRSAVGFSTIGMRASKHAELRGYAFCTMTIFSNQLLLNQ